MLKSAFKTLAVLACSLAYAASAQAIEWNANSHRVLQGDYNSDGVTDFYLAARPLPLVLPLNGLSVQMIPRTQHSFVLQSATGGGYTVLRPLDMARVAQVTWTPAPYSTLVGDYNGDGLPDLLLRPDASGQDGLLLTQNAAGTPRLAQILNSQQLGIELSAAGGFQLQWKDVNGDGKADLLMTKAGVGNQVLLAGISGFSAAQAQAPGTVVSDKPLTTSAGGIAEGAAEVSLDGTLSYSYPLTLPAGVNGLKPNLSIQYANNQADGYLGASWSLAGISAVSRCAASVAQDGFSGIPDGSSADKLCLDGQRLQLVSGTHLQPDSVYHTEQQSFTRVTLKGSGSDIYFEAQLKDGTTQVLGETLASRVVSVGSGKVQAWQLSSLRDAFNNKVDFTYKASAGTLLPARISYAGAQIDFVYRDRSPSKSGYAFGGELRLEQLLQKITTSAPGGGAQQEYVLGYQVSNIAAPRISFLQHCATASGQAKQCLEPNKFTYGIEPLGFSDQGKSNAVKSFEGLASGDNSTLDWNGDGFTDLLSLEREALTVTLGGKNGLGTSIRVLTGASGENWRYFLSATAVDYNMDGSSEILVLQAAQIPGSGNFKFSWRLLGANGSNVVIIEWEQGGEELSRYGTAYGGGYDPRLNVHQIALSGPKPLVLDYSRDGRPDLVLKGYGGWTKHAYNSGLGKTFYEGNVFLGSELPWFSPFKLLSDGTWQLLTIVPKNGVYNYAIGNLGSGGAASNWQDLEIPVRRSVQLDMNGDGNPDFVAPAADGRVYAYINKGGALSKDNFARIDLNLPTDIFADDAMRSTNEDYIPRPMDYDGDGRQDLLIIDKARNSYAVLRSRGQSFEKVNLDVPLMVAQEYLGVTGTPPQLPKINCTEWKNSKRAASLGYSPAEQQSNLGTTLLNVDAACRYIPAGPLTRPEHSLVGDFNGDGQDDLLLVDQKGGEYVWHAYTQLRKRPELLSSITDSLGNQTQVSYGSITDPALYQGGAAVAFPEMNWRGPRDLVSSLKRSNGVGGLTESLYEYRDAKVNVLGRGFLGFATQMTKEPARQRVLTRKFKQQFPLVGALTEESLEVKGKLLSRRTLDYLSVAQTAGKVQFVAPKSTTSEQFELDGSAVKAVVESFDYDAETGSVKTQSSETRPNLAGAWVERSTLTRQYQHQLASWLLGFVTSETRTLAAAGAAAQTVVTQRTPQAGTLAVASEVRFAGNPELQQNIAYSYDAQGNPSSVTTSTGNAGSQTQQLSNYQSQRFPGTLTNALGHVALRSYDAGSGQVLSSTDANGLTTTASYDGFGRLLTRRNADGSQQVSAYQSCGSLCLLNERFSVTTQTQGAPAQHLHYDSLGRTLREAKKGFAGTDIYVDRQYDTFGRLTRETQPYNAGSGPLASLYRYDDLDRLIEVQAPSGALISNTYAARSGGGNRLSKARTFNREGQSQTQLEVREHDAAGRLVLSTNAANSAQAVSIGYQYDGAGNLLRTQVNNDPRTAIAMTYDLAGNRVTQHDPNSGLMTYSYDALGRVREVLAPGVRTLQSYDALGRLTARQDFQGTQQVDAATWTYDSGTKAIGKLTGLFKADGSFVQGYVYDSQGRLQARGTDIKIAGVTKNYTTSYAYDAFSRPLKTTWASGFGLLQRYNAQGYLIGESSLDGSQSYRSIETQNARGQNTRVSYGNGVVSDYRYDDASGGLKELDSSGAAGVLQQLRYSYDPIGLLTSREDQRGGYSEHFDYDALQRLSASQRQLGSTSQVDSYGYDALGNLLRTPQIGTVNYTQYDAAAQASCTALGAVAQPGPHAALQSSQGAYCYDARGNQIAGPNRSISYSVDNKPLVITSNGQASEFRYDPDHKRFYQSTPERSTYYLDEGQFEEVSEGGQVKQNTYASGYLQHQKNLSSGTSTLKYKLNDQLGSVDVVLNAQGQVLERLAYAPFGGRRGADWSNNAAPMQESRRGFTGHEHLEESKLIHMNGRVYDPSLGRFLSADIVYQDATNAQMFNRYAYGFNSPFSGTDPTGYAFWDFLGYMNPLKFDWFGSRNLSIPGQSFFKPIATTVPWAPGYGLGSKLVNGSSKVFGSLNSAVSNEANLLRNSVKTNIVQPVVAAAPAIKDGFIYGSQIVGGAGQIALGGSICTGIASCLLGAPIVFKGIDNIQSTIRRTDSYSQQALESAIGSKDSAIVVNSLLDVGTSVYGLARSVPKIGSLGLPMKYLFNRDPVLREAAFNQAKTSALFMEGITSGASIIDSTEKYYKENGAR
ncbi:MAG: FG-GAP-like repeat-containing protein [Pseudomonas sp.]|uniref:FG-GAP-like repeat-containing protein n=1 Tax=Pseudomonas sp. TaxID=306 RepID=UPI003BB56F12